MAAARLLLKATEMPNTRDDLTFAGTQQGMSDEEFLQAWHAAVTGHDEQRYTIMGATHRWARQVGTTALPFDFRTRRAIGFPGKVVNLARCRSPQRYSSARPNT